MTVKNYTKGARLTFLKVVMIISLALFFLVGCVSSYASVFPSNNLRQYYINKNAVSSMLQKPPIANEYQVGEVDCNPFMARLRFGTYDPSITRVWFFERKQVEILPTNVPVEYTGAIIRTTYEVTYYRSADMTVVNQIGDTLTETIYAMPY